jgi:hypothetical protein
MHNEDDEKDLDELLRQLCKVANNSTLAPLLVKKIQQEHRTHQQTLFRQVIHPLMQSYSVKTSGQYDGRNAATVAFCQQIKADLDDSVFPYI